MLALWYSQNKKSDISKSAYDKHWIFYINSDLYKKLINYCFSAKFMIWYYRVIIFYYGGMIYVAD